MIFSWFRKKIVKSFIKGVIKDIKDINIKQKAEKLLKENKGLIVEKVDEKAGKAIEKLKTQVTELIDKAVKELAD